MRGYKTMYDYRGKVAGMIVSSIALIVLIIQKYTHFTVSAKLNADQTYNIILWVLLAGMFTIAYSFEKIEDERVKQIRAKAVMIAFMVETGAAMAFGFAMSIAAQHEGELREVMDTKYYTDFGKLMMFFPAVAIVLHLVIFHIGLYFDQHWDYSDNITIIDNLKKNPWHILVIAISAVVLIEIVSTLFM